MIVSVLFFVVYFSVFLLIILLALRQRPVKTVAFPSQKVPVSILIAARNEAGNIERCLRSIEKLNYPQDCLEVLIGDDASTDNTAEIVRKFIAGKPQFRLISISENLGQARGKANVLAHLTHAATSGFFFITDADVEVPENWINAMLFTQKTTNAGIVTGITTATGTGFFARMQTLDWLHALGLIQVVSDLNQPVTTMGNNMLITRQAYESTGGYENLPFSITEDIQIFQEVLKRGFGYKNVYSEAVLALTLPARNFSELLHQRKRWMKGAMHLPFFMKLVLILYASFYVVLIPFFFRVPFFTAFSVLAFKWGFQSLFIQHFLQRLNRKASLKDLLLFEIYQLYTSVLLLFFYFLPVKVNWKGRKY